MSRQAPPSDPEHVHYVEPVVRPIVKATDLGSVQVLKQGNLYLLTDPFGDVHPDSRGLGLYDGRHAPPLVRDRPRQRQPPGPAPGLGRGQLAGHDPDDEPADRARPAGQDAAAGRGARLAEAGHRPHADADRHGARGAAPDRQPRRGPGARERGAGARRRRRGHLRGPRLEPARARSPPAGGDAPRPGHVPLRRPRRDPDGDPRRVLGAGAGPGAGRCRRRRLVERRLGAPRLDLAAGAARPATSSGSCWTTARPTAAARAHDGTAESPEVLFPPRPRVDSDAVAASYHAWNRSLAASAPTTSCSTSRWIGRRATCGCCSTTARRRASATSRPACPGSRRCSGGTRSSPRSRPCRSARSWRSRRSRSSPRSRPTRTTRSATPSPARSRTSCARARWRAPGELPHRPYYGTVDATPLWLILLGATWDWTGDRALVDRLWPNALRALDWIDHYGDLDGDGFLEYQRRTQNGLLNQGWKDSHDAIRDRHGRLAEGPIALAEVQGYVFDAKRRMAQLARVRGDEELADRLDHDAEVLRGRFEEAFWSEDQGYYAMALDGDKRQADAIGSNAGHCLWSGIVSPDRAQLVVDRLMSPEHVLRLGDPDLRPRPARLQPHRLPHGHRLAARRGPDRGRVQALRPPRRGEPAGRADLPGEPALRRLPAAGAVLRVRPRQLAGPRAVPGRVLAAGLGRGVRVPVRRDDAGAPAARPPPGAGAPPPGAARTG